jgi:hypothetical protein
MYNVYERQREREREKEKHYYNFYKICSDVVTLKIRIVIIKRIYQPWWSRTEIVYLGG